MFVPIPGSQKGMDPARVVMAVAVTIALAAFWPHPSAEVTAGQFAAWMVSEAALGIGMGLGVGFVDDAGVELVTVPGGVFVVEFVVQTLLSGADRGKGLLHRCAES